MRSPLPDKLQRVVASMQVARTALFTTMACKYTCRAPENARESISTLRILNNSIKAYQIYSPHVRGKHQLFRASKAFTVECVIRGINCSSDRSTGESERVRAGAAIRIARMLKNQSSSACRPE